MSVSIVQESDLDYCHEAPFHPSSKYPEYQFRCLGPTNPVYEAIRTLFLRLNLDAEHYNTSEWNPLGHLIKSGDVVLIKPNLVRHYNPIGNMDSQVTHGSIIRAVLDYVFIALKDKGTVIIGDAPVQSCNFGEIVNITGVNQIIDFYHNNSKVDLKLIDFRKYLGHPRNFGGINRSEIPGDPEGYSLVNLSEYSELFNIQNDFQKFRVTNYNQEQMINYHNTKDHCYLIANSALHADVIINLPKLKTHRKAGITCAMKNIVGIVGSKDCLPHHRIGSYESGGDEYLYEDFRKKMITSLNDSIDTSKNLLSCRIKNIIRLGILLTQRVIPSRDPYSEGSWYGNDTISRTIVDLNKIIMFADHNGILRDKHQRNSITIVDAINAGEKEGPLMPSSKLCRTLIAGENPVEIDLVCSCFMGFDYRSIPALRHALTSRSLNLFHKEVNEIFLQGETKVKFDEIYQKYGCSFTPTSGWKGHIECNKFERKYRI